MNQNILKEYTREFTVLYVEDEESLRKSFAKVLQRLFKEVTVANDGKEGLFLYDTMQTKPDFVITDIRMPFMDGIELTKNIRQKDQNQIIFILSAHNESNYLLDLINLDVDGFLLKPIDAEKVFQLLYKKAKMLYDLKMLDFYQQELEHSIKQLEYKQNTIDFKTIQSAHTLNKYTPKKEKLDHSIEDFYQELLLSDVEEFRDDLYDFDTYLITNMEKGIVDIEEISRYFKTIATVLLRWSLFLDVGNKMMEFANSVKQSDSTLDHKKTDLLCRYIESLLSTLDNLARSVLLKQSANPVFFNQSLIGDLEQISILFSPVQNDDEVEFF